MTGVPTNGTATTSPAADAFAAPRTPGLAATASPAADAAAPPGSQAGTAGSGGDGMSPARPDPSGPPASAPASGQQATANPTAPAQPGEPAGASRPGNVPGVDDGHVYVGVYYFDSGDFGAYGDTMGVEGIGTTDQLRAYEVLVDLVNSEGGVAGGRELAIVTSEIDLAADREVNEQRACEKFTNDARVLIANLSYGGGGTGVPCLVDRGVMSVGAGLAEGGSQHDFEAFGGLYQGPGLTETITAADAYVEALIRQELLTADSKIGLLWFDFPAYVAAREEGLIPALERHGLKLTAEFRSSNVTAKSEAGRIAADMQNASLQFKSQGVDTVLSLDLNATLTYFFMNSSEQQAYRPRYGLATWSQPNFLALNAPAAQLEGASGIGWMASHDVDGAQLPGREPHERCEQIMSDAGMPVTAYADRIIQHMACTTVFFWQALLNNATDLSPAGLVEVATQLQGFPSYTGFAESFGPDKHWGAAAYRDVAWDAACGCFAYSGTDRPF